MQCCVVIFCVKYPMTCVLLLPLCSLHANNRVLLFQQQDGHRCDVERLSVGSNKGGPCNTRPERGVRTTRNVSYL